MLNTLYIILYKSPRDSMQIMVLGRHIFPGNTMERYQDENNQPCGFLLIDFKDKMRFRLRSGLFLIIRWCTYRKERGKPW